MLEHLNREISAAIAKARDERALPIEAGDPFAELAWVDELHIVLTITSVRLENDEAHEYLIAASAALTALHTAWPIDDIQGIPIRYWRLLIVHTHR